MSRRVHFNRVVRALSAVALGSYFLSVAVHLAPMNPMTPHTHEETAKSVGRYMSQNWSLFAPTPATSNLTLEAAYLDLAQLREVRKRGASHLETMRWHDLTSPLIANFHGNRISGSDRTLRPMQGHVRAYLSGGGALQSLRSACESGHEESCVVANELTVVGRQESAQQLARIASAACSAFEPECEEQSHVVLRIRIQSARPWSKRHSDETRATDTVSVGIHPFDHEVLEASIYPEEVVS